MQQISLSKVCDEYPHEPLVGRAGLNVIEGLVLRVLSLFALLYVFVLVANLDVL
jgi:hypothetical protein